MAPSSLRKLGAAIAFASAGRVAAHSPDLLGSVVDAIFGEAPTPTPTHTHTTSYVTGTSTAVNDLGETTVVVVVGTTICPVTASEAAGSSVLPTAAGTSPVPAPTTATSATAAVAVSSSHAAASGSAGGLGSTPLPPPHNSTSVPMTTSTIFSTRSSTVTACPTAAPDCTVGDVTTVVVALSTTICPVTATEGVTSNSTTTIVRPTGSASGTVPGPGASRTGAHGATTLMTTSPSRPSSSSSSSSPSSSSARAQTTITSASLVLTTVPAPSRTAGPEPDEAAGTVLEMATGSPSDYSAVYTDATETVDVPSGPAPTAPATTNYNDALMSLASSVEASSAEQTGSACQGMDCIVVSNSGVKSKMNASGFALVALAGAVFLL